MRALFACIGCSVWLFSFRSACLHLFDDVVHDADDAAAHACRTDDEEHDDECVAERPIIPKDDDARDEYGSKYGEDGATGDIPNIGSWF